MQTYPGLLPVVELIPDMNTGLSNKVQICPIDRQYVRLIEFVKSFATIIRKEAGVGPYLKNSVNTLSFS